jgi:hypothetical protein
MRSQSRSAASVRTEKNRPAFGFELQNEFADSLRDLRIKSRRGFVKEQNLRLVNESARQREFLLHPFGKGSGTIVPPLPQIEQAKVFFNVFGGIGDSVEFGEKFEVAEGRQPLIKARAPPSLSR